MIFLAYLWRLENDHTSAWLTASKIKFCCIFYVNRIAKHEKLITQRNTGHFNKHRFQGKMTSLVNPLFNPDETSNELKAQLGKNSKW
jgi:hypothetical protein